LSRPIATVLANGLNTAAIVWGWGWNTQTQKLQMLGAGAGAAGTAAFADASSGTSLTGFVVQALIICQR
jgi:hypothetical protein